MLMNILGNVDVNTYIIYSFKNLERIINILVSVSAKKGVFTVYRSDRSDE